MKISETIHWNMSDHIYTLAELSGLIKPILKKYNAEQAVLFGSYARQEATPGSDIDLYVIGGNAFDPTDIFCIADELYKAAGKNVDVYEKREIKTGSPLHNAILQEGVLIV